LLRAEIAGPQAEIEAEYAYERKEETIRGAANIVTRSGLPVARQNRILSKIETFYNADGSYQYTRLYRYMARHVPYNGQPAAYSERRVNDIQAEIESQVTVTKLSVTLAHFGLSEEDLRTALNRVRTTSRELCRKTRVLYTERKRIVKEVYSSVKQTACSVFNALRNGARVAVESAVKGLRGGTRMAIRLGATFYDVAIEGLRKGALKATDSCDRTRVFVEEKIDSLTMALKPVIRPILTKGSQIRSTVETNVIEPLKSVIKWFKGLF
jgi:hypothetical protein